MEPAGRGQHYTQNAYKQRHIRFSCPSTHARTCADAVDAAVALVTAVALTDVTEAARQRAVTTHVAVVVTTHVTIVVTQSLTVLAAADVIANVFCKRMSWYMCMETLR